MAAAQSGLEFILGADITDFKRKMNQASGDLRSISKDFNGLKSTVQNVGALIGVSLGLDAIRDFGKEVFDATRKFESLNKAMAFSAGSSGAGAANMAYLRDVTQRLGLELVSTAQGFKTFNIAATQAGISNQESIRIFESVSKAVKVMGLSAEDANGVFLAMGQIISKGNVSAEELRGQIGERLPGAFAIAARSIGVTEAQLNDMLKRGEVLSKDFLPKFADELEKTFGAAAASDVSSLNAEVNLLTNAWTDLLTTIGGRSQGAMAGITSMLTDLVQGFANAFKSVEQVQKESRDSFLATLLKEDYDWLKKNTEALGGYKNALDSKKTELQDLIRIKQENIEKDNQTVEAFKKLNGMVTLKSEVEKIQAAKARLELNTLELQRLKEREKAVLSLLEAENKNDEAIS